MGLSVYSGVGQLERRDPASDLHVCAQDEALRQSAEAVKHLH